MPEAQPTLLDVVGVLAHAGDLSMGQPTGHSPRAALFAATIADELGLDEAGQRTAALTSLLRWSGCSANASGFAGLLGDDIGGRADVVAGSPRRLEQLGAAAAAGTLAPLAASHCDVAQVVASCLGLDPVVVVALGEVFERWDGHGLPLGTSGSELSRLGQVSAAAASAEIAMRTRDITASGELLAGDAGSAFDPDVIDAATAQLATLEAMAAVDAWRSIRDRWASSTAPLDDAQCDAVMTLVADFADAKSAWALGFSRRCAALAAAAADAAGLGDDSVRRVRRAALTHRLGRVAVSSRGLDRPGGLLDEDWEQIRLWPLFTEQSLVRLVGAEADARVAGAVQERLDGSGYPRGLSASSLDGEQRLLAVVAAYTAMTSNRPDRPRLARGRAAELLRREADQGRLDRSMIDCVVAVAEHRQPVHQRRRLAAPLLARREIEVLTLVADGATNHEVAATLGITSKTVNTYLERSFRKLGVTSRTAAVIAALQNDLLPAVVEP